MKIRGNEMMIALGAIGAYTLVAGVWIALLHVGTASADARPELPEWHALAACLVGSREAGELPSSRVQDIAVAVEGRGTEWPASCLPLAEALDSALDPAEPPSSSSLHEPWRCLDRHVEAIRSSLSIQRTPKASEVDQAFECAERFVAPASSAGGPGPFAPEAPRVLRVFPDVGEGRLAETDPHRTRTLRTRLTGQQGYCRVVPEAKSADCAYLPDELLGHQPPAVLAPTSHETETFLLLRGSQAEPGAVHRASDGRRLFAANPGERVLTAFARADGVVLVIVRGEDGTALVTQTPKGATRVLLEDVGSDVALVDEHLLWMDAAHLFARRVTDTTSKPADLGELDAFRLTVRSCASGDVIWAVTSGGAVRIHKGGYALHRFTMREPAVSCRDGVLALTAVGEAGVTHQRCDAEGCAAAQTASLKLDGGEQRRAAVALGDQVLVVHSESGVRMRLAPLADLDKAPERVIMHNDSESGGVLVHRVQLQARDDAAYLVLHTGEGAQLVRIDEKGDVTPIVPE